MTGRSLILIFLFFVLVILIPVCNAEIYNDSFTHIGSTSVEYSSSDTTQGPGQNPINSIYFNNIESLKYVELITMRSYAAYTDAGNSHYENIVLYMDGQPIGTGIYGYSWNPTRTILYVHLFVTSDGLNIGNATGATVITFTTNVNVGGWHFGVSQWYTDIGTMPAGDDAVVFRTNKGIYAYDGGTSYYNTQTSYIESFDFTYSDDYDIYRIEMERSSSLTSKTNISISGHSVYSEHDLKSYNLSYINDSYYIWDVTNTNLFGDVVSKKLVFGDHPVTGTINYNQTFYAKPETVGVIYDIENIDLENYEYWILLTGTNGGTTYYVTNDYYDIVTATGQNNFSISYAPLSLPFQMRAELWTYSRLTGESSTLAYTPWILYNPASQAPGKIWTEKSNYNISEMFYILYDTNYPTAQIELISASYHDIKTVEGPGEWFTGYMFSTPHDFTAYLIEDGVRTNSTQFTVSADAPFLNIYLNSVPLKQHFSLEYFTDNTSDTITGYRPDGSVFYGPITDLIIHQKTVLSGISSASPPGVYTISLLHDETTYYNDTIEMFSTTEYVYFEASKYYIGDRIKIYSYVTDSRQQVRLSDSLGNAVITWTAANQYIIPNTNSIFYFTLSDNNEYGMNVNASIDAGVFRNGNWKIEIIDIDGRPLTDESAYDYTTVSRKIDSPADASNEMISIFFSPEGLFFLFTAALTMMGLVAVKHPAGGGAGAVVGVGFGVYFNVLPAWMLMLMVIALVVLAGVSVAVYFRGK